MGSDFNHIITPKLCHHAMSLLGFSVFNNHASCLQRQLAVNTTGSALGQLAWQRLGLLPHHAGATTPQCREGKANVPSVTAC